ncbi:hypothetical protein BV22DRAFT_620886 [Leucogyrophana mollusca]|uniref:Uncharacterized protein n=1 Tax=Leucogyrophana mollusca TaxID=85980 RepID=A0ACB8BB68_9AGAM|nr:hypothetical protein BV22DRAFT_620886 [Leucogyrophana mollusca]
MRPQELASWPTYRYPWRRFSTSVGIKRLLGTSFRNHPRSGRCTPMWICPGYCDFSRILRRKSHYGITLTLPWPPRLGQYGCRHQYQGSVVHIHGIGTRSRCEDTIHSRLLNKDDVIPTCEEVAINLLERRSRRHPGQVHLSSTDPSGVQMRAGVCYIRSVIRQ